jgi:micrococcal nuclease
VQRLIVMLALVVLVALGGRSVLAQPEDGRVTRVVDGDTLHVRVDGRDETVRLIGIDTPELHRPGTPVQCGAQAATHVMEQLADGQRVELVDDPSQDDRDRYGRRLAYAVTEGGDVDLGEAMLRRGWAEVYVFDKPFERLGRYREAAAAGAHRGVAARCG